MDKYRPEIDGLRAIAILPVIFFHAGFNGFSGGFIGVDVFFVISGYLITGIIYQDINNSNFSLLNFYERRARRILPNLLFLSIISTTVAWFCLNLTSLEDFGKSLIGVVSFSSNFYFWLKNGYFSESTELMPLMHTWSLAVEEQFYLFFPIIIILLTRISKKNTFSIILFLVLVSLGLSIWGVNFNNPNSNFAKGAFYLLPTRAWELGIGAIVALLSTKRKYLVKKTNIQIIEIIGVFLIILPIFFYSRFTPFPGFASIIPVIGTGILIFSSSGNTFIGKFLSNKVLIFIGLMSYSLYLWHHVIFSFWRNTHLNSRIDNLEKLILIIITFIIAYLSFRFIETPFRNKNFLTQKQVLISSLLTLLMVGLLGCFSILVSSEKEVLFAQQLSNSEYIYFQKLDERKFTQNRIIYEKRKVSAIIMGSSRIMQLGTKSMGISSLNLSVSSASIEDFIALVPESINKFNPKICILGSDPWLFNKNSGNSSWTSIKDMYIYWKGQVNDFGDKKTLFKPLNELVKENWLLSIYNNVNISNKWFTPYNDFEEDMAKKTKDGLCIYTRDYANQTQSQIAKTFPEHLNFSMKNYEFDKNAYESFLKLINFLKRRGIKVVLVLSPYHPELFKVMKIQGLQTIKIEDKFREIASRMNVQIIGSYDVTKISKKLNENDFFDGMHPKKTCMDLIIKEIINDGNYKK